jgi:hypothetical protein
VSDVHGVLIPPPPIADLAEVQGPDTVPAEVSASSGGVIALVIVIAVLVLAGLLIAYTHFH